MAEVLPTRLAGPLLLRPKVHADERGFFLESYRLEALADLGVEDDFVQDNHSRSRRGVLRGLHFQAGAGMAKLVRCGRGTIRDVIVDIRPDSPTFGEWEGFDLSDENHHQLYCPVGFAHGFCVTSDLADVMYRCSTYYDPELERTLAYDDPALAIEWPELELIPSERDRRAPRLHDIRAELQPR